MELSVKGIGDITFCFEFSTLHQLFQVSTDEFIVLFDRPSSTINLTI